MDKMKIYIAGPMTGIKDHNFPEFNKQAAYLRSMGFDVVNPAELDAGEVLTHPWDYYLRRDLKKLVDCQVIVLLNGWENSKGANLEYQVAKSLGMTIKTEYSPEDLYKDLGSNDFADGSILQEAQRLVGGDRGTAYGHPYDDMTRTGKIWAGILGLPEVTAAQVAKCMIGVKLSRECNSPKRDNRVDGAGYWLCLDMIREREEK